MRIVIAPPERPACRLQKGEARRVPGRPGASLVGYHISCPGCGWPLFVVDGHEGQRVTEAKEGLTLALPVRCSYCGVEIAVKDSEATLREVSRYE
jgi:DNA-directed RNA polymerase subunit RPC12/RpoP